MGSSQLYSTTTATDSGVRDGRSNSLTVTRHTSHGHKTSCSHWHANMQPSECTSGGRTACAAPQGIYGFKGRRISSFLKNQWHALEEILSYSHSRTPDLPVAHSLSLNTGLAGAFFFPICNHVLFGQGLGFLGGGGTLPSSLPDCTPTIFFLLLLFYTTALSQLSYWTPLFWSHSMFLGCMQQWTNFSHST